MSGKLEARVALVTGGSRGIGYAIAQAFHDEGARVVISGRDEAVGLAAARKLGTNAAFLPGNVLDASAIDRLVQTAVSMFGRLDVLVNKAGGASAFAPIAEMSDEMWQHCVDGNLTATFRASRAALKTMIPSGYGRIINISSVEGKHGKAGLGHYTAAKHGIHGLTKVMSKELGPLGITVNAICPGLVITDMIRESAAKAAAAMNLSEQQMLDLFAKEAAIGRAVTGEEVAAMAVLLGSDAGGGISGAMLSVDGGTAAY